MVEINASKSRDDITTKLHSNYSLIECNNKFISLKFNSDLYIKGFVIYTHKKNR